MFVVRPSETEIPGQTTLLGADGRKPMAEAMKVPSSVMSLKEAAAYLHVSKGHLSNVINGKVPGVAPVRSFRLGRRVLFKREWIDEWLESSQRKAAVKW